MSPTFRIDDPLGTRVWMKKLAREDRPMYLAALAATDPENDLWYAVHGVEIALWEAEVFLSRLTSGVAFRFNKRSAA